MGTPIHTRDELRRAIQQGEQIAARLVGGAPCGGVTERALIGRLLYQLANVARRAFDYDAERFVREERDA